MEVISDRISILRKPDVLSIVILPTTDKRKLGLMFLWLLAWSVCGVIVFANYFRVTERDARLFIIIYLAFWSYFEFNIIRAYVWKRFGREKLWLQHGKLNYQREIRRKGKIRSFNLDLVGRMTLIPFRAQNLADNFYQSFWVKGGERLEFTVQGRTYRLGMQINEAEAGTILKEVNRLIPQ
jgi:hypothetical protein